MANFRYFRIAFQIIFFGIFIYLFLITATVANKLFINYFFQFDPLLFLTTSIATRIILPFLLPLVLIILTLFLGRIFCGFVCPLGAMIDGFDYLVGKIKVHKKNYKFLKYYILLFLITISILGASVVYFFDPIVIMGRIFTTVFMPAVSFLGGRPIFQNGFLFLLILVVILGLSLVQKRFWCGNLCPLGGLLALLSQGSLLKYSIREDCKECNLCAQLCPTRAIDIESKTVSQYECVRCMNCLGDCPKRKIVLEFSLPFFKTKPIDISRRGFITSVGLGIITAPLFKTEVFAKLNQAKVIRPPGAIPEKNFVDTCIRCGECIKLCPTRGLQPIIFQKGISGLFSPQLVARLGGCERHCNGCGQVCPTGAIRSLPLEEKDYVKVGTAVIHKEMCLAWEQDKVCLICDEACPYNAIDSKLVDILGVKLVRPFINEELCTGCGICESRCPINGPSAIEVLPIGEERIRTGSYITQRKKELRELLEKESKDDVPTGFIE